MCKLRVDLKRGEEMMANAYVVGGLFSCVANDNAVEVYVCVFFRRPKVLPTNEPCRLLALVFFRGVFLL